MVKTILKQIDSRTDIDDQTVSVVPLHIKTVLTLYATPQRFLNQQFRGPTGIGNLSLLCMRTHHGPLTRYAKLRDAHAPGMLGTFSPPPRVSDPDMHHGTCVTHVLWCMPGSLTSGFLWSRCEGKRSRHSRRMRNPQFCVSGKRPIVSQVCLQWWEFVCVRWIGIPNLTKVGACVKHIQTVGVTTFSAHINTLRSRQNGRHFTDDTLKCNLLNINAWI